VLAAGRRRLDAYVAACHLLGRDVTRSGIFGALHIDGVVNVTIASPAADIVIDRTQASWCTGITVTHAGTGE
jgi:phage-related baseplate assembly protein